MPESGTDKQRAGARKERRQFFEREVSRLMDRLYGTALRLTRDPDDAEDVVAEAIERAWAKLEQLQDPQHIEGWLFRILNNTFIGTRRRRRCRQDLETALDTNDPDSQDQADFFLFHKLHHPFLLWWSTPEETFFNQLLHEDIRNALDSLPDAFRIVVVLVEIEGQRYEEVARLLDIPVGTVRSRLSRGRSLLQKALWEQGVDAGLVREQRDDSARPAGGQP